MCHAACHSRRELSCPEQGISHLPEHLSLRASSCWIFPSHPFISSTTYVDRLYCILSIHNYTSIILIPSMFAWYPDDRRLLSMFLARISIFCNVYRSTTVAEASRCCVWEFCPSVWPCARWQNERTFRPSSYTTWRSIIPVFVTKIILWESFLPKNLRQNVYIPSCLLRVVQKRNFAVFANKTIEQVCYQVSFCEY